MLPQPITAQTTKNSLTNAASILHRSFLPPHLPDSSFLFHCSRIHPGLKVQINISDMKMRAQASGGLASSCLPAKQTVLSLTLILPGST